MFSSPPHTILTEIMRNAGLIVRACSSIREGRPFSTCDKFDLDAGQNLRLIEVDSSADDGGEEWATATLLQVINHIRGSGRHDATWDVQVLVARNDERRRLNKVLQAVLNPAPVGDATAGDADESENGAAAAPPKFRLRDKIICLRNTLVPIMAPLADDLAAAGPDPHDPESYADVRDINGPAVAYVANGDIGRVEAVSRRAGAGGRLIVRFLTPPRLVQVLIGKQKDDENKDEKAGDTSDFDLAYAITCHKSQGSEWPVVIIMGDPTAAMLCTKEWWYTAISRAKLACLIIGSRVSILKQCRRESLSRRRTMLVELLTKSQE